MTNRGVSLVEVLIAGVIASVIAIGSLQSLKFAMQSGTVSRSILTENDFKLTLSRALTDNCLGNLKAPSIANKANTVIPITSLKLKISDTDPIIEVGTFKTDIQVVKMEVKAKAITDTRREFIAYYRKNNLGHLNTVAEQPCDATATPQNLDGCYTATCKLDYEFGDDPDTTGDQTDHFLGCKSLTCHPVVLQVAGSVFPCPWGELYRKTGTKKCASGESPPCCDKRDKGPTCIDGKELVGGKCKCKADFVPSVDGRCVRTQTEMIYYEMQNENDENSLCKLIGTWNGSGSNTQSIRSADKAEVKKFCSIDWDKRYNCVVVSRGCKKETFNSSDGRTYESNSYREGTDFSCYTYYRRFYDRESGTVRCLTRTWGIPSTGSVTNPPKEKALELFKISL